MKTTMPAPTALYLIDAMLAACSNDFSYTPILDAARLTREGRALRAISTDRYRIHEVTLDSAVTKSAKGEQVIVPAAMLRKIKRAIGLVAPRRADRAQTTLTLQTRKFLVAAVERTRITAMLEVDGVAVLDLHDYAEPGNYPPLERLTEKAAAADHYTGDVMLNLSYLGKMEALNPGNHVPARVKHTVKSERPGIVVVTYETEGVTARGFLQPNLMLR